MCVEYIQGSVASVYMYRPPDFRVVARNVMKGGGGGDERHAVPSLWPTATFFLSFV